MDAIDKKKQPKITEDTPETVEAELRGIFDDAFYEEAKQIEAEIAEFDLEMDAEQKARLKAKVMARFVAAEEAERGAKKENATVPAKTERGEVIAAAGEKKGKRSYIRLFKRIAVTAAVICVAMVGITVQSQAGKDGIWSSIQRLIGSDSRWEQKDNGEDRQYTDPEEWKAIAEIEEKLEVHIPKFYYWPDYVKYVDCEIIENPGSFTISYVGPQNTIYFKGWKDIGDTSDTNAVQDNATVLHEEYENVDYTIIETKTENQRYSSLYSAVWNVNNTKFLLSNLDDLTNLRKILKNIKN